MIDRTRTVRVLLVTLALALVPAALARADRAYDRVAAAYAQAGGQLDACAFTEAQLAAGLAGIPPEIKRYVPDLRRAIKQGIATHVRGDCAGRKPGTTTTPPAGAGGAIPTPEVSPAPPATTTQPAVTPPAATTTGSGSRHHDTTPLAIALGALGALLVLLLALWGWARARGWDPPRLARARHAWGEAGHRTTSTWLEFTDWLRLGR
ncbi:MAG TPA: hypothetical protein VE972_13055 [Conexibacter sp.]|nr:hypothetical protein [Conexibacter sp.]